MERPYSQQPASFDVSSPYNTGGGRAPGGGGGYYDNRRRSPAFGPERDEPRKVLYERPSQLGAMSDANRYSHEGPAYGGREPPYEVGSRSPPQQQPFTYGSRHEPGLYGRTHDDSPNPYQQPGGIAAGGSTRDGPTYNPYEQPQPSPQVGGGPAGAGSPMDYRTEVSTSRSGRLTTTFKAEPIPVGEGLRLNPGYFKTCHGILKILQIIMGMVCLGCSTPALTGCARLFLFVTATCYIMTVLLCIIIVLGVDRALYQIRWLTGELIYTAAAAVCFSLVSIILLADIASYDWPGRDYRAIRDQYIAAGIFGLVQACLYGFGLFRLFIDWKATRPVPAPRTVTTN